jgi:hypothetical protein
MFYGPNIGTNNVSVVLSLMIHTLENIHKQLSQQTFLSAFAELQN